MKKRFIIILILFSSFLFVDRVKATNDIASSLENSFNFDNIVIKKMAYGDVKKTKVGYFVTLAYPKSDGTYAVKKQQLYIYKSYKNIFPKSDVLRIRVKSKFNTNSYRYNDIVIDENNNESFLDYSNITNKEMLNNFLEYLLDDYKFSYPNEYKNKLCSSLFFVEPMYITGEIDTRFINSLKDDDSFGIDGNCNSYSDCDKKSCLAKNCNSHLNSSNIFKGHCENQCKKYSAYLNIFKNNEVNLTYSDEYGATLENARGLHDIDLSKMFNLPTITQKIGEYNYFEKIDADKLSSGWGFYGITPFISIIGHVNAEAKEYCYYNVAACENGELLGTCIKENSKQTIKKAWICPSGYNKVEADGRCYYDTDNPIKSRCSNGGIVEGDKCVLYAQEYYKCDTSDCKDKSSGSLCGQIVNSASVVCTKKKDYTDKCPSGTTISESEPHVCVARKKTPFKCSRGSLQCKTGYIGSDGKSVKECQCVGTTGGYKTIYKLHYMSGGVCSHNNYAGGGGCNNTNGVDCSHCNNQCNEHLYCAAITTGSALQHFEEEAYCDSDSGYEKTTGGVDNKGHHYVRCRTKLITNTTTHKIYPSLKYDCNGSESDSPICSTVDVEYYYDSCPSGSVPLGDAINGGLTCRHYANKYYGCPRGTSISETECDYNQELELSAQQCNSSAICNPTCPAGSPKNSGMSLSDCIKDVKSDGITINGHNYKAYTFAQAFLYCRLRDCGETSTCVDENEALQTKTVDIVSCILQKSSDYGANLDNSKLAQFRDECTQKNCTKKCYLTSASGDKASCDGKYDKSQIVTYNESESVESSINICDYQSPRISKYGRFISQSGNCKLYCRQTESKISLPTNILEYKRKSSFFEWPTRSDGNHLRIVTTNKCYIFTATIDGDSSNCAFTNSTVESSIKSNDDTIIKLNNDIKLTKTTTGSFSGDIKINKNLNNPNNLQSFTYTMTSDYKIPANSNNMISVNKAGKILSKKLIEKDLGYGVIQIPKDATVGKKDLKLSISNYGFNNQFGSKVDGYTCHYNVTDNSCPICEQTVCKGELTQNNNYYTYNNKVIVKSYTDKENKICNLEYSCKSKVGVECALKSCVMTYYAYNDWIYDVELMDSVKLESAVKHCSNLCSDNKVEKVIFREISTTSPFPGINGKGRVPGTNWIGKESIATSSDKSKKLYEIIVTSENIKNIRNYNKTNDYDDWTLDSDGLSTFIRNTSYVNNNNYKKQTTATATSKCPKIVTPASATAKINTVEYATLQAAINAATSGQTVVLNKNTSENIVIDSLKDITLNLNGKTLSGTLTNNGTVKINGNGIINGNRAEGSGNANILNNGTMIIENGTFKNNTCAHPLRNDKSLKVTGGTFELASGNSTCNATTLIDMAGLTTIKNATIKVTSGTGYGYVARDGTSNSISNCTIISRNRDIVRADTKSGTSIKITDSTLTQNVSGGNGVIAADGTSIKINNTSISESPISGKVLWINSYGTNYSIMWWGGTITKCKIQPSNSGNWRDFRPSSSSHGNYGNYYACVVSRTSSPSTTSWDADLYNGSTNVEVYSAWTWK